MSKLTEYIRENLVETSYSCMYFHGVNEPTQEQLQTLRYLVYETLTERVLEDQSFEFLTNDQIRQLLSGGNRDSGCTR